MREANDQPAASPSRRRRTTVSIPEWAVRTMSVGLAALALGLPWGWHAMLGRYEWAGSTSTIVQRRPELVRLPAGVFIMGSPEGEGGRRPEEGPQHVARVAAFEMCRTEVTQAQWIAVMGDTLFDCDVGCGDTLPAQNISWDDAVTFSNALSTREDLVPCYVVVDGAWTWPDKSCSGYRLPTETEWEYAARAGTTTAYSFGDDLAALEAYAWFGKNADRQVHAVSGKLPSPWGLLDMHGNVAEWVWDWYGAYPAEETAEGYAGPREGDPRALRGGSFGTNPQDLRSAYRNRDGPTKGSRSLGFRCVRGVLPEPSIP